MIKIEKTDAYVSWYKSIDDRKTRLRVDNHLLKIAEKGHFGDIRNLGGGLFELRMFFGGGIRIYYTHRGSQIILLLVGGDKSSQRRDIPTAREMIKLI